MVETICDCGVRKTVFLIHLKSAHTQSCGCLNVERRHRMKYSVSTLKSSPHVGTYSSWKSMIYRCTDPKHPAFARYGGRGVRICERWMDFENFLADMGIRPIKLTLERNDNDGNYEPDNCRWATRKEQTMNQTHCHGEANWKSKLTEKDVRTILKIGKSFSGRKIASLFGVSPSVVSCILLRKTWKHVII